MSFIISLRLSFDFHYFVMIFYWRSACASDCLLIVILFDFILIVSILLRYVCDFCDCRNIIKFSFDFNLFLWFSFDCFSMFIIYMVVILIGFYVDAIFSIYIFCFWFSFGFLMIFFLIYIMLIMRIIKIVFGVLCILVWSYSASYALYYDHILRFFLKLQLMHFSLRMIMKYVVYFSG